MASVTALGYRFISLMFLPVACWVLWTSAGIGLVWRIEQLSRAKRIAKAKPQAQSIESFR
jgi:hypothetical protein